MSRYEETVMNHYSKVAKEDGDSSLSTMKDAYIREKETQSILSVIEAKISNDREELFSVVDVGCGNGYTLSQIKDRYPNIRCVGIEKNSDLRIIATKRFENTDVEIKDGDVLDNLRSVFGEFDVVITQRVIINILDEDDQRKALQNISALVKKNGFFIMMECFESGLRNLNEAREEYGFEPIKPSYHNMYLKENLVDEEMKRFEMVDDNKVPPANFLSSHYYVTRVLHDLSLNGKQFVRNSHFVKFFSKAIPEAIGDYSPIKLYVYKRNS